MSPMGPESADLRRQRHVRYCINIGNGRQMLTVVFRRNLRRRRQFTPTSAAPAFLRENLFEEILHGDP